MVAMGIDQIVEEVGSLLKCWPREEHCTFPDPIIFIDNSSTVNWCHHVGCHCNNHAYSSVHHLTCCS